MQALMVGFLPMDETTTSAPEDTIASAFTEAVHTMSTTELIALWMALAADSKDSEDVKVVAAEINRRIPIPPVHVE